MSVPIKPENRSRYPADWPQVRERILKRAGYRCEHPGCTAAQYDFGRWLMDDRPPRWQRWGSGAATYTEARQLAAEADDGQDPKPIVIVLTVAHLNHTPEDVADDNLRALCQRHHLAHDHDHHRATAQDTRRAKAGTLEMF